jgi:hypothetical protein
MGSGKYPRHSRCLDGACRKCKIPIKYKLDPICINCAIWGNYKKT